ncbi:MAG TPA: zf-HC2 domain-containing protein [Edaphobacter sp.]|uniref:anti-sigma factor family protein n=1 Tax=Edaphobacter sp. TaxID=1934404 RepID=UPI002C6A5D3A|nr:zf-HC2 domain-containing protein [Edaphobacter sp.]HUZ93689.1 zf-HC2 domain-containing protein [Edaphobacter sp.]
MAEFNQFGSAQPPQTGEAGHCAQCEAMLADALDGTLSTAEQAMFNLHMATCSTCSAMLADAQRGAEWLEMLKSPRPEPSAALLERILAQTCNAQSNSQSDAQSAAGQPQLVANKQRAGHGLWQPSTILGHSGQIPATAMRPAAAYASTNVLPFRSRVAAGFHLRSLGQTLLQPRLAMTAAMAFFSIALTMNITGVRLSQLRVSDLRPTSIKRNITQANASVHRYYDNLKVVYELESRVRDLQRSTSDTDQYNLPSNQSAPATEQPAKQQPAAEKPDSKQSRPKPGPGSSQRETRSGNVQFADSTERPASVPATQAFVVFTPSILKDLQEGELV